MEKHTFVQTHTVKHICTKMTIIDDTVSCSNDASSSATKARTRRRGSIAISHLVQHAFDDNDMPCNVDESLYN